MLENAHPFIQTPSLGEAPRKLCTYKLFSKPEMIKMVRLDLNRVLHVYAVPLFLR